MEELRRRMSSAKAWASRRIWSSRPTWSGRCRFLDAERILGAFWTPSVGVVDSLRAGTIMRERALATGALTVVPTVEVTGLEVVDGRIRTCDHRAATSRPRRSSSPACVEP
jgi:glycine/D-amino acid oxidase-like deaminating enzyme